MPSWMYFVLALAGLLAGYWVYGAIVEKVFGPDPNRPTPACKAFETLALSGGFDSFGIRREQIP